MRVESPRYTERFGSVRINDLQKVLELAEILPYASKKADIRKFASFINERLQAYSALEEEQ